MSSIQAKMTNTNLSNSIGEQWDSLIKPYIAIQTRPLHWEVLSARLANAHGKLESRIYRHLSPQSAYQCMHGLRALPPALIIQALPSFYQAGLGAIGAIYLWPAKDKIHSARTTIKILNSLATAFLFNAGFGLTHSIAHHQYGSLVNGIPVTLALSASYFYLASGWEALCEEKKNDDKKV
jgi:hypothetical protein